jgi:phosphoglycerate dehydrogenase-like enzyme
MIDADAFAALPPHAWLINIARGALVDENALLSALDDGRLAGAALDAVVTEPLPPTSPFWGRPNVTVTPHHTWSAQDTRENAWQLFADNLRRYVRGEPLTNLVDHAIGY